MSGRDQMGMFRQLLMKRQPRFFDRVNISEAVQIKQRRAIAVFQEPDFASVDFYTAAAHQCTAGPDCAIFVSGYSRANSFKESRRNTGATFSAKSFMLLRAR